MPKSHLVQRAALVGAIVSTVFVVAPAAQARGGVHCGSHIKHSITLRRNLHNCRGDGLVVAHSNVVINLHGHTIDGRGRRGTAGVRIRHFHGVTVKFGVIRQFGRGVWLVRAGDNKIQSNVVSGSFDEGIFVNETSPRVLIQNNRISWSGTRSRATWADGIDARGPAVTVVANSVRHSHDDGIDVNGAGSTIDGNNVAGSVHDGIDVDSQTATVQNNTSTGNGDDGIGVGHNAANVTIRSNVTNSNTDLGIQPIAGTAIDGGGNRASGNGDPRQCVRIACAP
jgi:parallel beta-helix repeat protein